MTERDIHVAKTLHVAASGLLPILEEMQTNAYDNLLMEFRNGKVDNLARIAECNAYNTVIEEINYRIKRLETHYAKEEPKGE
jgi:uncharacterized iron-regulated protein